jgi:hypothetical protein
MAPRLTVAFAVGAVACLALAGCTESERPAAVDSPSRYVEAVEALLDPAAQVAAIVSEQARHPDAPAPSRARLERLVRTARERLAELRALRLRDPGLRADRDRLADAYAEMVPHMQAAADALAADDRASLAAADPFLDSLRTLPSAVSSPSR